MKLAVQSHAAAPSRAETEVDVAGKLATDLQEIMRPPAPLQPTISDDYERPIAELIRPHHEIEGEPLAAILGVPFDTSILGRQGAKLGPAVVRHGLNSCL